MNEILCIVVVFLLICLVSGLYAGRNTKNFKQFAVGDKNFSAPTLVATIIATNFGGGFLFRGLENIYTQGFYYALASTFSMLGFSFFARFMVLRMQEFTPNYSIAESMGVLFGPCVRIITACSGMLFSAGAVSIQVQIIAKILNVCCHIEGNVPIGIAILVVLIYSTFGGIKAVTFTDIIQCLIFCTLIPVLAYLVGKNISNYNSIVDLLTTHPKFDFRQIIGWNMPFFHLISLTFIFFFPTLDPASAQRFYMTNNIKNARRAFWYTGIVSTLVGLLVVFLAMALLANNPNLNPKALVEYILETNNHIWLKSLLCIGVLSLAMSTADSFLHSASILCTHDLLGSIKKQLPHKFLWARVSSIAVGIIALILAYREQDLLALLLLTLDFYRPVVSVPLIMAIFGFRPTTKSVLMGMGAGALTVVLFKIGLNDYLQFKGQYHGLIAVIMNLVFLISSHYLGFKKCTGGHLLTQSQDHDKLIQQQKKRKEKKRNRVSCLEKI